MPKWGGQFGATNGQWKGGRVIASNGYVLIRVGQAHHLADVRGYAYEHRIVAEEKVGRRLLPSEQIHHLDGDKTNNSPDNLSLVASLAAHREAEGKRNHARRVIGQPNPTVRCACGCGSLFALFDKEGRARSFVNGHNMRTTNV